MNETTISACYVSPSFSKEQFIPNHSFLYVVSGSMEGYDGQKKYKLQAGECVLTRRNRLAKYSKLPDNGVFKKIVILFGQDFLKFFFDTHTYSIKKEKRTDAFIPLARNPLIENFITSLAPYFTDQGTIDEQFLDVKRNELLLILLKANPELANILFDFSNPEKIDLEEFMHRNFRFNVSIERFAYLTGRSLSAFKRDFEKIFKATPSHWLVQKRLEEAYFLIEKEQKKPSDIYLDLGFEDFSHFSYSFKKLFGHPPTQLKKSNS
ncbi:helix-turn-helix domain-containing protein [Spirosoma sp. HMF4905]|uniref:Helix-turn-helix domain-containing protein n=1 Tax=Spirosoma arboris TaxID=2682092 RepID=A0A7K1SC15_9BACT|nr:AraC family transcriptional regulator [Spirosoma arboris]MVM31363.1 helix-turn-helix domain-containing protein [Spirosoma arboris]